LRAVERRLSTSKDDYIRTVQESSENIQWTDPDIEELQAEFNDLVSSQTYNVSKYAINTHYNPTL